MNIFNWVILIVCIVMFLMLGCGLIVFSFGAISIKNVIGTDFTSLLRRKRLIYLWC